MTEKIRIAIRANREWWQEVKAEAQRRGMLLSGFVTYCIRREMGESEGNGETTASSPPAEAPDSVCEQGNQRSPDGWTPTLTDAQWRWWSEWWEKKEAKTDDTEGCTFHEYGR